MTFFDRFNEPASVTEVAFEETCTPDQLARVIKLAEVERKFIELGDLVEDDCHLLDAWANTRDETLDAIFPDSDQREEADDFYEETYRAERNAILRAALKQLAE